MLKGVAHQIYTQVVSLSSTELFREFKLLFSDFTTCNFVVLSLTALIVSGSYLLGV